MEREDPRGEGGAHHRKEEIVFRRVPQEDRGGGDPCALRDLRDGHAVALGEEDFPRDGEEGFIGDGLGARHG